MNNQNEQNTYNDNQGDNTTPPNSAESEYEIIYIAVNPAMPDYVKIGKTSKGRLSQRIKELSGSNVPFPFEPVYACSVPKNRKAEKLIHKVFDKDRVPKKEFFKISPDRARYALLLTGCEEVTIDDKIDVITDKRQIELLEQDRKRRERFRFDMVGIDTGATLIFIKNKERKVTVADNRKVRLENGDTVSLSNAAMQLLKQEGYNWKTYRGSDHFMYEGEILTERRERMESEGVDDNEDDSE